MIEDTIREIETRLNASPNVAPETRNELLTLLGRLRAEAARLPKSELPARTPLPEAESAEEHAEQLRSAVEEFEDSHPKIVQMVNHLANTLAGLGI